MPSAGKTRLRASLDGATADSLYQAFFADIATWRLPEDTSVFLAVTEPLDGLAAVVPDATVHLQQGADFGERVADAVDTAFSHGADRVVIVGTDCPTLPAETVADCFAKLRRHRATIVPAADGGWIALGLDRPIGDALRAVPWSSDRTCRATERALRRCGRRPLVLRPWYDIDDRPGLQVLRGEVRDRRAAERAPRTASVLSKQRASAESSNEQTRARERVLAWLDRHGPLLIAAVVTLVSFAVSALRFYSFYMPAYDLGFFDQVASNTANGHLMLTTFLPYSFLGEHWSPSFGLIAQLYRIVQTPIWLILVQSAAFGAAAIAAARLARVWLPGRPHAPVIAAFALAVSPLLTTAAPVGFHTEALTPAVALFALEAAATRRRLRFVLLLVLLAAIKEDALLVAAGVGWVAWRADRERLGLIAVPLALAGFLVVVLFVMPFFRGGQPSDLAASYSWLSPGSTSIGSDLRAGLTHPGAVLAHLVSAPALRGWAVALLPLALLPLLSGWAVLGAVPPLLVALLSDNPVQGSVQMQYGLEAAPLLLACALLGWRRMPPLPVLWRAAPAALLAAAAAGYWIVVATSGGQYLDPGEVAMISKFSAIKAVLDHIPSNAPVAASSGVVPHISDRQEIFEFPGGLGLPYVVLDIKGPFSSESRDGYAQAVARMPGWHYRVIASGGGVTLWKLP
ncbi:MAG: DUF2064 domain-containing protein [Candidatus Dormibacteraeota bacterium]|nr:DUF2064 domain-containing protein [Candidatus Dormibacteraeota bacterium]